MNFAKQLSGKLKTRPMISCEECGREFQRNRKADLMRHMRIHTNEKPFVCPYPKCGKAFKQSAALKNHSNFHERNQAFTCEQCQLNFFDKPTFNRHTREKHDLEFVFACSLAGCNKSFKRKSVLKAHMLDKHDILCNDEQLLSQRVSAGPYLNKAHKAAQQHRQHSNSSPLPKIADTLDFELPPLNDGMYYLNPAVHGFNNAAPVLLNDPYSGTPAKPAAFAPYNGMPASMAHYAQAPSECPPTSYSPVLPSDFQMWLTSSGPNDTSYFNVPALDVSQLSPYGTTVAPSMTYSSSGPRTSPNASFVYSSGSSGNSGRAGSFTPPTPYSRTASSSPINPSPASSPGRHSPSQEQAIPRLYRPKGTYY